MKRCVVVAAGPIGPYEPLRALLRPDDVVFCADGGLSHARALGLEPTLVLGDFDSVPPPKTGDFRILRFAREKDETDTLLAVRQALDEGFRDILILGGLRGRLDHTFANFSVLLSIARRGAQGVIADAENEARILLSGEMRLKKREGFYVSVFPFGEKALGVTERGLKYSLTDAELDCGFPLGVSNEFDAEEAVISVKKGPLLIIFSKKE